MRFLSPEWLLLLPILLLAAWWWKRFGLRQPLRFSCALLLILILAQPQIRRLQDGLDLSVLVDQSASVHEHLAPRLAEWEGLLERSMGADDRITYFDFGEEVLIRGNDDSLDFSGNREQTRIATATRFALSQMATDRAHRLLLFSDGYSTEPLGDLNERLLAQNVALDFRLAGEKSGPDYRIDSVSMPHRVQSGEPFLIEVSVSGQPDATIPFTLSRNGRQLTRGEVDLRQGRGQIRLAERIIQSGSHHYEIMIHPENDSHAGNNFSRNWIEISGGPRILLITGYTDDPLIPILQNQGFEIDVELTPPSLNIGRLTGARAVIINNVPAREIPSEFVNALDFFVRAQGGGLLMAGGKKSFGSGGHFDSPIAELLPVSTELRQDHRKLATAMAIVLDRSGSMHAGISGGLTKMDLANEGTAQTIELLGPGDAVAVFAVDTQPHVIVPLTQIGQNTSALTNAVRRIASAGGGIFVYSGLQAAWAELQRANHGQRHLILFADANDAKEPGNYKTLIAEMVAAGTTISVIGLGSEHDSTADFLKDIAERGGGRIFFNSDAQEIPSIFAQETVTVARSMFIEEPTPPQRTAGWTEITARQLDWPPNIDGFNLSYLKPKATAGLLSADENEAPLVAFWQRGIGRSAAVSFPLGGEFSESIRSWHGYGDFIQTLGRWLAGDEMPSGYTLRSSVDGDQLSLELLYSDQREQDLARSPPQLLIHRSSSKSTEPLIWERMEPGRFQTRVRLEPGDPVRGAAQVGANAIPFGPILLGRSPEWDFEAERIDELRHLARLSGGEERLDLSRIWESPRQIAFTDLRLPLLLLFFFLFLIEAAWTRLGGRLPKRMILERVPEIARPKRKRKPRRIKVTKPQPTEVPPQAEAEPSPSAKTIESTEKRRSRFDRAKRRGL